MKPRPDRITVYTDGSSSLKSGWCGWSAIVHYNGLKTTAAGTTKGTNQLAELYAIIYVMRRLPKDVGVTIVSDSQYAIKSITEYRQKWEQNGYKNAVGNTIAHKDLVVEAHVLFDSFEDLNFIHVRGHRGVEGNEEADGVAKSARSLGEGKEVSGFEHLESRDGHEIYVKKD